ncbi:hypothetical protein [Terasakiella sp. SH-1]|uniref:hypothetical protein n=1 Tax=Terasakiella sp. SH-1 TaxID=2560057 RepID=UPI0010734DB2|nr:hypothetical protein [Terasakiella sp. SH-1]
MKKSLFVAAFLCSALAITSVQAAGPNKDMRKGLKNVEQALQKLKNAPAQYHGHRARAIKLLKQAQAEIEAGIAVRKAKNKK